MKKNIRVKVQKEVTKNILTDYASPFEINDTTKVFEVKTKIKEKISFPFEIVEDTLYSGNKELKDDDTFGDAGGLVYKLIIK